MAPRIPHPVSGLSVQETHQPNGASSDEGYQDGCGLEPLL